MEEGEQLCSAGATRCIGQVLKVQREVNMRIPSASRLQYKKQGSPRGHKRKDEKQHSFDVTNLIVYSL